MGISAVQEQPSEAIKSEWLRELEAVLTDIESWATEAGWHTRRSSRRISEDALGQYDVPVLDIEVEEPRGRIVLEPVGRNILGATGRIDVSAWPRCCA